MVIKHKYSIIREFRTLQLHDIVNIVNVIKIVEQLLITSPPLSSHLLSPPPLSSSPLFSLPPARLYRQCHHSGVSVTMLDYGRGRRHSRS